MALGVLMDIAGVLYDGDRVIDGAPEAVRDLRDADIPIRFLTNSTRRPKRVIVETLHAFGIAVDAAEVLTPASAVSAWLRENGYTPHLLIHPALAEDFSDVPSDGPVAVVVGDAGPYFTFERMNAAFRALETGAPLLALAYNRAFQDGDGQLSIDAGAFVRALEFASGRKAQLFGKPAASFFAAGAKSMGLDPGQVVMIGDDAESDVAGAISTGLGGGILVQTGKYRRGDEARFDPAPSFVAAEIGAAVRHVLGLNS